MDHNDEITLRDMLNRLTAEAMAEGYRRGIEAAAKYHDDQAERLKQSVGGKRENYFDIAAHQGDAAIIRTLTELPTEPMKAK